MENIAKIRAYLIGYGYGYGYGDGDGSGSGDGYGYGDGDGSGSGSGYGDGDGSGSGSGYGYGDILPQAINGEQIFIVDNMPTIFKRIMGSVAKVQIVDKVDFTLTDGYVVKGNGLFAHGRTTREAREALDKKFWATLDAEQRICEFIKTFDKDSAYKGALLFDWHNKLTGSCLMGRTQFVKEHNLSLESKYTIKEFINLCENDYGGNVIKRLRQYYFEE